MSLADYVIANTLLSSKQVKKIKIVESDAKSKDFHRIPDHVKKILYLDCPDIIVEKNSEPILTIEDSKEAGTGHNSFQRFARIAASVENNVTSFYIYPEAKIITRSSNSKWDVINPYIFNAMDSAMIIYDIAALLYYYPSYYRSHDDPLTVPQFRSNKGLKQDSRFRSCPDGSDSEMKAMFKAIDKLVSIVDSKGPLQGRQDFYKSAEVQQRRQWMSSELATRRGNREWAPLTATTEVPTQYILNYLSKFENSTYKIGELIRGRKKTLLYKIDGEFRGDPYPGALAAIDYMKCRHGKTFEDREMNLGIVFGTLEVDHAKKTILVKDNPDTKKSTINDFFRDVQRSENKNLLGKSYDQLHKKDIPRYYMQVRYGSTYSKVKHIRVYSYFADMLMFPDGSLWRDG